MRLDRYISNCGIAARSDAKKLIKSGRITVDGIVVKAVDTKVNEGETDIRLDGEPVLYRKYVYLMLNKPKGYVSATEDKHYKTVMDFVPEEYRHYNVSPVGRLDIDTEGLLILSNDGAFTHNVITPKKNIYKRYYAELDKAAQKSDIETFAKGMEFKDFTAKPAVLEIGGDAKNVFIEIAEGKYHQVKRMCERVGKNVVYLKRVKIGGLSLDETLCLGKMRELTEAEVKSIFE